MTVKSRPATKSSTKATKPSGQKKSACCHECPITRAAIADKNCVISTFKVGAKVKTVAYDKAAITAWMKKYSTCPATNKPITQLVDKDGKVVLKKPVKKESHSLTLSILIEMHPRLDRMDRVSPPALERLSEMLKKSSKEAKASLKDLGIRTKEDLLGLQEKIDRVASIVTTAHFLGRLKPTDRTLKNLVTLLKDIRSRIAQQLKVGTFKGFAEQSLKNKRGTLSKLLLHLGKLGEQRGAALEKSFEQIAAKVTSPLELEQVCSLAPQVLLHSKDSKDTKTSKVSKSAKK